MAAERGCHREDVRWRLAPPKCDIAVVTAAWLGGGHRGKEKGTCGIREPVNYVRNS